MHIISLNKGKYNSELQKGMDVDIQRSASSCSMKNYMLYKGKFRQIYGKLLTVLMYEQSPLSYLCMSHRDILLKKTCLYHLLIVDGGVCFVSGTCV